MSGSPLLLAVESATARASVALLRDDRVLAVRAGESGQHHCETLLPMLDALLGDAGVTLSDVEAFALSIGPGAFTSLRIGLATVKGLAFGSDLPVVAVSTLEALARGTLVEDRDQGDADPAGVVVATLDARRNEVYAAAWQSDSLASDQGGAPVLEPGVYAPERLFERLPAGARVVGEGAAILRSVAPERHRLSLEAAPASVPEAVSVGRIGLRDWALGRAVPAADLLPRYLRRPQAEEERVRAATAAGDGPPGRV